MFFSGLLHVIGVLYALPVAVATQTHCRGLKMYIVFIKGSGCMGTRFDDPAKMGKWIAENLKAGQEIVVQLYV